MNMYACEEFINFLDNMEVEDIAVEGMSNKIGISINNAVECSGIDDLSRKALSQVPLMKISGEIRDLVYNEAKKLKTRRDVGSVCLWVGWLVVWPFLIPGYVQRYQDREYKHLTKYYKPAIYDDALYFVRKGYVIYD